jgi:Luciferase-like monooxygenase
VALKFGIEATEGGHFFCEVLAEAIRAEELGFDSVWLAEHHGVRDHCWPSPLQVLTALAPRTSRITLGTNVVVFPFYHPVRLAEEDRITSPPVGRRARFEEPGEALVHRELGSTGCITLFTTYSPILSPISVPTRVEER